MIFKTIMLSLVLVGVPLGAHQQQRFEDVVRNLRNPDAKVRLEAVRLLRDARYPEAIAPMAVLVNDPVDEVQLEALAAELSFYLNEDVKSRRMVGFVVERRNTDAAAATFAEGPAIVWPRAVPPVLVTSLLAATNDDNPRVRHEAIYETGVIARAPLEPAQVQQLLKALDSYDPDVRRGAALVIGRLKVEQAGDALIKAVNDSHPDVRYAAMTALGEVHDTRAIGALREQLAFYRKGEGAWAALDALAHMPSHEDVATFTERLGDKDPYIRRAAAEGLGRAGDASAADALERGVSTDDAGTVRMAMAFGLQKLGRNYMGRIIDLATDRKLHGQAFDYLTELGPAATPALVARLQDPDAGLRELCADALGFVGGDAALAPLQAATKDGDAAVATAATRAIERIRSTAAPRP